MNLYESIVNEAIKLSEGTIEKEIEKAIFLYLDANEIDVVPVNDIVEYSKGKFNHNDIVKVAKDLEARGKVSFNDNDELITRIIKDSEQSLNEEDTDKYAKYKEFADSIDLTPLYDKIKQMAGISNIEFTSKVIERPGDVYIDIKSNDLIDSCGLFKLALRECYIETFNSGIVTSKDTNNTYWWGTMDLRYQSKQGGTNGVRFLRFSYNEEPNKWLFNEED